VVVSTVYDHGLYAALGLTTDEHVAESVDVGVGAVNNGSELCCLQTP